MGVGPASRAIQCVRTQDVVAARSSGVGRRNLDRRAPEERSMYDYKLGRSEPGAVVRKSAIKVRLVRSMTELMMCVHQKAARPFCTGIRFPREVSTLRRGQQAQIGDIGPQARRDEYVPSRIRE